MTRITFSPKTEVKKLGIGKYIVATNSRRRLEGQLRFVCDSIKIPMEGYDEAGTAMGLYYLSHPHAYSYPKAKKVLSKPLRICLAEIFKQKAEPIINAGIHLYDGMVDPEQKKKLVLIVLTIVKNYIYFGHYFNSTSNTTREESPFIKALIDMNKGKFSPRPVLKIKITPTPPELQDDYGDWIWY
ncbi:hypothetical protein A2246_04610 [candidate division WOR-1 bacterium RIFOXYA2_FULL_37_7]|uniref:Uncharacterized protein n=1 Tax=candidate division WOR-1 bacterium RIFOXYB2_FULL_37_13 TaxID=1802579 RepID=A0A1F4SHF3_UNCSA|nr:MAG: hypothetical protein A2246_04610 [candidate division WOR-1 bacterium RIFOXYA2_FULL_37_7]OGC19864.1 MAG: hypothetical protein A2310_05895 [candidate division WOR-1 bacterium RIFOXYB2_FULL_37_13]